MGDHYGDDIRSVGANLHQAAREMAIQIVSTSSRSICLNRAANVGETTRIQTHKDRVPGESAGAPVSGRHVMSVINVAVCLRVLKQN